MHVYPIDFASASGHHLTNITHRRGPIVPFILAFIAKAVAHLMTRGPNHGRDPMDATQAAYLPTK